MAGAPSRGAPPSIPEAKSFKTVLPETGKGKGVANPRKTTSDLSDKLTEFTDEFWYVPHSPDVWYR